MFFVATSLGGNNINEFYEVECLEEGKVADQMQLL